MLLVNTEADLLPTMMMTTTTRTTHTLAGMPWAEGLDGLKEKALDIPKSPARRARS